MITSQLTRIFPLHHNNPCYNSCYVIITAYSHVEIMTATSPYKSSFWRTGTFFSFFLWNRRVNATHSRQIILTFHLIYFSFRFIFHYCLFTRMSKSSCNWLNLHLLFKTVAINFVVIFETRTFICGKIFVKRFVEAMVDCWKFCVLSLSEKIVKSILSWMFCVIMFSLDGTSESFQSMALAIAV